MRHHPSEQQLLSFADGLSPPAEARIVSIHHAVCEQCQAVTGLDAPPVAALSARVSWADGAGIVPRPPRHRFDLTGFIRDEEVARWRWAGPGLRVAAMPANVGIGERSYLLAAARRARLPSHGHRGKELVLVLRGGFDDGQAHYGVGDVSRADDDVQHAPAADRWLGCICLFATEAPLRMTGLARLVQPFVLP